jgi:hypothetical protein
MSSRSVYLSDSQDEAKVAWAWAKPKSILLKVQMDLSDKVYQHLGDILAEENRSWSLWKSGRNVYIIWFADID